MEDEPELRDSEVELALEGGEADQERPGEQRLAPAGDEDRPSFRGRLLDAGRLALAVEDPGADDRERGAAEQQEVRRTPERHVLAEDPVPEVVERERDQRDRGADRD